MTITNKFFNESGQRNIPLNMSYYLESEAEDLKIQGLVGFIEAAYPSWRVFLHDVSRIEVETDESGTLATVAYMKNNDERLYVVV